MPVTPLGTFCTPAQKLQRMVSLSPTFQAGTHTTGHPDLALQSVKLKNVDARVDLPRASITLGDQHGYRLVAGGGQNQMRPSGSLMLYMARLTDPIYFDDTDSAELDAGNFFGQVIDDIAAISGADDTGSVDGASHLPITSIDQTAFYECPQELWNSLGRFYFCVYRFAWGDGD